MAYEYHMEVRERYVVMALRGQENLAENKASVLYARDYCAEHGKHALLVDLREISGGTSVVENYEFAGFLAETAWPTILRIATVYGETNREIERFLETAGQNRGVQIRAFPSMDAAQEWLTQGQNPAPPPTPTDPPPPTS